MDSFHTKVMFRCVRSSLLFQLSSRECPYGFEIVYAASAYLIRVSSSNYWFYMKNIVW